jgi:23S rRNA (guanine745-N1)-methyltransferase
VLDEVIDLLACPHCGAGLVQAGRALRCPGGHAFDVARQGYVNLLPRDARSGSGDTPAMVAARAGFMESGHLAPIAEALAAAAERALAGGPPGGVVDLGAGTGHHLARALERLPGRVGLALDRSPAAARHAARAHPRLGAVVCDLWAGLPVRSGAAALALNVFAPRNGAEIRRALHPRGALIVVSPTPRHLGEVVGPLGLLAVDPRKPERLDEALGPHLRLEESAPCEFAMALTHGDVERLVGMGPSARHADPAALGARIAALPDHAIVTASVTLALYRPR